MTTRFKGYLLSVLCAIAFTSLVSVSDLHAQSKNTPAPGNPDVFLAFLRMHHTFVTPDQTISAGSAQDGSGYVHSTLGWQRELGLNDADFAALDSAYMALNSQLNALNVEADTYISNNRNNANAGTLQSFRDRELSLINAAAKQLRTRLSPAGATSLFKFIDGRFLASVKMAPLPTKSNPQGHQE